MSELISEIWSGLTSTVTNLASAVKDVFLNLIYTDPSASTKTLSEFAKFGFLIMGVGLGFTTVWMIIRKIKG